MDSVNVDAQEERRRREEAEKELEQTKNELEEYKAKLKSLNALTGTLNDTNISTSNGDSAPRGIQNVSALSRKGSDIFADDPLAKTLKVTLRQLLIQGDTKAQELASNATKENASQLVSYLKEKSGTANIVSSLRRRKERSAKEIAREEELAEMRAQGGIRSTKSPSAKPNFENAFVSSNLSSEDRLRAQERFASKRERPQSYGLYNVAPTQMKPKFNIPTIPTVQHPPLQQPKQGLLNLSELSQQPPPNMDFTKFSNTNAMLNMNGMNLSPNYLGLNLSNPLLNMNFVSNLNSLNSGLNTMQPPPPAGFNMPSFIQPPQRPVNVNDLLAQRQNQYTNVQQQVKMETMNQHQPPLPQPPVTLNVTGFELNPATHSEEDTDLEDMDTGDEGKTSQPRRWTEVEDQLLLRSVQKYGARNWKRIATEVPGRNHVQCLQRWRKALDPSVVKGHWSSEEDAKLLELVQRSPKNWGHVARGIEGRTAKQCRERYHNHLDPKIRKGDWSFEEDKIIVVMQKQVGNKWAEIAKSLEGRTENSVKIRWKSIKRQVTALRAELDEENPGEAKKRKPKRNTMDKERLEKLLVIWETPTSTTATTSVEKTN